MSLHKRRDLGFKRDRKGGKIEINRTGGVKEKEKERVREKMYYLYSRSGKIRWNPTMRETLRVF